MIHTKHIPFLAICLTVFGLGFIASDSQAQGYRYYGQNSTGFDKGPVQVTPASKNLGDNVAALENIADQMIWRYGWELRKNRDCRECITLYNRMKKHVELTNQLMKAYKGTSQSTFEKMAYQVSNSVNALRDLQGRAKVSESVRGLINQSEPLAVFVCDNTKLFQKESQSMASH